jgi:hypothetical protein
MQDDGATFLGWKRFFLGRKFHGDLLLAHQWLIRWQAQENEKKN